MPQDRSSSERRSVQAYVTPDVAYALNQLAKARDLSVSAVARELIRDGLSATCERSQASA